MLGPRRDLLKVPTFKIKLGHCISFSSFSRSMKSGMSWYSRLLLAHPPRPNTGMAGALSRYSPHHFWDSKPGHPLLSVPTRRELNHSSPAAGPPRHPRMWMATACYTHAAVTYLFWSQKLTCFEITCQITCAPRQPVPWETSQPSCWWPRPQHLTQHRTNLSRYLLLCSVAKSCPTLCDPMDCSTSGFPVFTISQTLFKLIFIESVMPFNHLILCC